jgi:predicted DCC family thiol-disulfide oxidoreductase YuxK
VVAHAAIGPGSTPAIGQEPVVFFDGTCGLCHRSVAFLLERDPHARLRFAHLQGRLAESVLPREMRDAGRAGSVVLLEPAAGGRVSRRAEAILRALGYLPPPWRWLGALARLRPLLPLADAGYRLIVSRRAAWFGQTEQCLRPDARLRERFLESPTGGAQPA